MSGGPKHNAHRLCPVDAESVNMDREETHRLGLGPAGGESGHTRLLRQARGRSCAGWRGGEDHCCVVLLVLCVPKVYYRWVYLKQVTITKRALGKSSTPPNIILYIHLCKHLLILSVSSGMARQTPIWRIEPCTTPRAQLFRLQFQVFF